MSTPDVALVGLYPEGGVIHAGRSGVASYTANLARSLTGAGASVVVIADWEPGRPSRVEDSGIVVRRAFRRGALAIPRALAAARATGAPIVHLQHELFLYGGPTSIPGLVSARASSTPLVVTMHQVVDPTAVDGEFTRLHRLPLPGWAARWGIACTQRLVREVAHATIVHEPAFASHVRGARVIPHGVEIAAPIERGHARAALGLEDRFVVLCFGFLSPYKGLEAAIDAARHTGDGIELVIAGGEHPRLDGVEAYGDTLRGRAPASVRFTGRVPSDEVCSWFSAADVVLLPYPRPFSASGALALALAYRAPVLLSREVVACLGAPSILGIDRRADLLAARLEQLASDRSALAALRAASAALAVDRDWPSVAQQHLALYEEVIDGNRAVGGRVRTSQRG